MRKIYLISLLLAFFSQINAGFNAGVARKVITPDTPVWLSGYASRNKPSTEILHDLWAKALVIEEKENIRIIIVTIDIIGLSHELSENVANQGATAMFLAGCGADQNPYPRRSVELAMQHGKALADAVQKVLSGEFIPVRPPVRTYFTTVDLEFSPYDPDQFKEEMLGDNRYRLYRARFILEALDKGYDVGTLSYPVQAVRFNNDFTLLALSSEVVVDYSLKTKNRYPDENLFVAGYSTEVQCYIPSARVLKEGGYEPETSMIYYGLPGPFAGDVEEKVFSTIDKVMKKIGAKSKH